VNILEKIGSIISLSAATLGFSFDVVLSGAASADIAKPLGFSQQLFSYFKNHRLIFLRDLQKQLDQIASFNDRLECVLDPTN
jgi:hypothetical protein